MIFMRKLFAIVLIFVAGCTSSGNEKVDTTGGDSAVISPGSATVKNNPQGCYAWKSGKDSAGLNLQVSGTKVTGTLNYNLFEKDSNKGSITGTMEDDMIVADYTFQSEGMTSVREVVFKIDGDNLIEGLGDIDVEGDTVRYKNKTELEYNTERPFVKTDCK